MDNKPPTRTFVSINGRIVRDRSSDREQDRKRVQLSAEELQKRANADATSDYNAQTRSFIIELDRRLKTLDYTNIGELMTSISKHVVAYKAAHAVATTVNKGFETQNEFDTLTQKLAEYKQSIEKVAAPHVLPGRPQPPQLAPQKPMPTQPPMQSAPQQPSMQLQPPMQSAPRQPSMQSAPPQPTPTRPKKPVSMSLIETVKQDYNITSLRYTTDAKNTRIEYFNLENVLEVAKSLENNSSRVADSAQMLTLLFNYEAVKLPEMLEGATADENNKYEERLKITSQFDPVRVAGVLAAANVIKEGDVISTDKQIGVRILEAGNRLKKVLRFLKNESIRATVENKVEKKNEIENAIYVFSTMKDRLGIDVALTGAPGSSQRAHGR